MRNDHEEKYYRRKVLPKKNIYRRKILGIPTEEKNKRGKKSTMCIISMHSLISTLIPIRLLDHLSRRSPPLRSSSVSLFPPLAWGGRRDSGDWQRGRVAVTCLCLLSPNRTGLSCLISCLNYTPDTFSQTTADVEITKAEPEAQSPVSISLRRLSTIHIHIDHTYAARPLC